MRMEYIIESFFSCSWTQKDPSKIIFFSNLCSQKSKNLHRNRRLSCVCIRFPLIFRSPHAVQVSLRWTFSMNSRWTRVQSKHNFTFCCTKPVTTEPKLVCRTGSIRFAEFSRLKFRTSSPMWTNRYTHQNAGLATQQMHKINYIFFVGYSYLFLIGPNQG